MQSTDSDRFELFAQAFVRVYWETVKSQRFSMPPDEPVEKTVEELLSEISYSISSEQSQAESEVPYGLLMKNTYGDWWLITFRRTSTGWRSVGFSAPSDDPSKPHDLLDAVYSPYFKPFLEHVTRIAIAEVRGS